MSNLEREWSVSTIYFRALASVSSSGVYFVAGMQILADHGTGKGRVGLHTYCVPAAGVMQETHPKRDNCTSPVRSHENGRCVSTKHSPGSSVQQANKAGEDNFVQGIMVFARFVQSRQRTEERMQFQEETGRLLTEATPAGRVEIPVGFSRIFKKGRA